MGASPAEPVPGLVPGRARNGAVSELEHAQAALAETEARFGLLARLAPVGIVQSDPAGRVIFVNDRWCAMTGVQADEMMGTDWLGLLHPDDRGRVDQDLAGSAAHGDVQIDARLCALSGAEVWVQGSAVTLPGTGAGPAGMLAAFTDISDRKRAEAERERLLAAEQDAYRSLADQTERLNCLIAAAIPGVLITDEEGLVTHANEAFGTMFGIDSPDRLVGTTVGDTVRQIRKAFADPRDFVRRTCESLSARKPVEGRQIAGADGRTFECDYWPVMVAGRYRGDIWLAWDMSERKALEEQREALLEAELAARRSAELAQGQLQQQNEKLQELGEARTQFVATVSHELRTPLTSIVSFIELIRAEADGLSKDGTHFLDIIQRNAHRLLRLVGDLLLLSRVESGTMPLELAPVSIPEVAAEAVRDASAVAAGFGISLDLSVGDGPEVQADQLRLLQVLDNLIANAVKFSHPGDQVRVGAAWDGRAWRIDVTDSGIGIPPDERGQLFDRFVRASNARTSGRPGTGLGLSVVKAIVELHGGRIGVDSTLGRGTTFSVHLPVVS
jgi:PAS domain S-box-containing protein